MASFTPHSGSSFLILTLTLYLLQFLSLANGLQVTPGSECASYCLDGPEDNPKSPSSSSTNSTDIVCLNEEYWTTVKGTKYRSCMDCLQNSTSVNGTESDVSWYLYNLRYTIDVCLFSYPHANEEETSTSSPCVLAENCLPLRTALETGHLTPGNGSDYDYCSADNSSFGGSTLDKCIQCFRSASNQTYISNFLTALEVGCEQQPAAGTLLAISGTLFSNTPMNYTGATATTTSSGTDSTLATGAIAGIAVGASLLIASAILLFYLYWRRQKKQSLYYFPDDGPSSMTPTRHIKSFSSSTISGSGYIPHYTVDYKRPPGADHQRQQYELYNQNHNQVNIRPQHVVIPAATTAGLWGQDTPKPKQQYFSSSQSTAMPASRVALDNTTAEGNTGLDEMPTHPAFIPRAFTRGSRNPSATASEVQQRPFRPYKPDDFVVQQYLDSIEDASTVDVRSLISPPLPTANTFNTTNTARNSLLSNNPYANMQAAQSAQTTPRNLPPPPPTSPPVPTPNIAVPSSSHVRSPRRYVPPPINIQLARPKTQRIPDNVAESGMP